jgi:mono/diheme cytochrome c family protein
MADKVGSEQLEKRAESPEPDPIAGKSMSGPLVLFSLLMILTLIWSLYDEVMGQRPWKGYQREFVDSYSSYLEKIKRPQGTAEKEAKSSPEYQELKQAYDDARNEVQPRVSELDKEIKLLDKQILDITDPYQNARAWIAAKTYLLEISTSESGKKSLREDIEEKKNEDIDVTIHVDNDKTEDQTHTYRKLEGMYNGFRDRKAQLTSELIAITKPQNEAKKRMDDYLQNHMTGLTEQQVDGLLNRMRNFDYNIKQINIAGGAVVDRCESCHLGIREPLKLTGDRSSIGNPLFVSHPSKDLLTIHDPERFGCSTCHGGNGRGTTSEVKGHGRYKHWLWPLYYKENIQAGCNQCHNRDRVTPMADVLNEGKDLFQNKGCVGCHRYEGFDREGDALASARQTIKQLDMDRAARNREVEETRVAADNAASDEEARTLLRRVDSLRQMISQIDSRVDELDIQSKYLMRDQKKIGPNLKEIKAKLRKEWLPGWLRDPQAFRPGTKMPTFRLDEDEIKAISAFLWQSAIDYVKVQPQPQGDAARGRELFKTTGCLACHSIDGNAIGMGGQTVGGDFAANLSRVGEKADYSYIVRWVHNPRQRLAPYSPSLRRDLKPEDYTAKNLPFVFDDEHSKSPVDGRELQVQNMTVMPNFRLSEQDARDIASFLVSLKPRESQYPDASYLDDTSLMARGEQLVKSYGCAGCHEIRGLEEEGRIGTELTQEGSKPIERLDFALLTEDAKKGIDPFTGEETERSWYNHKGFFEYKLRNPGVYDVGKIKPPEERLKMPNIYLEPEEITALTTFLLGSVATGLPESIRYNPAGQKRNVQDGWWIVQKYNCMGCHNVLIGQDSVLMGLPMYQDADGKEQLPPRLTSQGARVNPDWLLTFLKDPSLATSQGPGSPPPPRIVEHLTGGGTGQPPVQGSIPAHSAQVTQPPPGTAQATGATGATPAVPPGATADLGKPMGLNRNGVRQYLKARMPTFNFSPNELQALVNFFMGASTQQQPYIPERLEPLTAEEQGLARALFTSAAAPCLKCHMTGDPGHDIRATAPNFLIAPDRLKPAWTERWLIDPSMISPGTSMPSGLFTRDESKDRWVFAGPTPPAFQNYDKDHVALLVRYMFQMTPDEQRRLMASGSSPAPAAAPAATGQTTGASASSGKSAGRSTGP